MSAAAETGTIVLRDGTEIAYRPISASDQAALQRFHARLSDRSIHQRFFCAMPALGDAQAHDFTHVDGVDRFALVALDPPPDRDRRRGPVRPRSRRRPR